MVATEHNIIQNVNRNKTRKTLPCWRSERSKKYFHFKHHLKIADVRYVIDYIKYVYPTYIRICKHE